MKKSKAPHMHIIYGFDITAAAIHYLSCEIAVKTCKKLIT